MHRDNGIKVVKPATQGHRNSDDFFSSRRSRLSPVVIRQAPFFRKAGVSCGDLSHHVVSRKGKHEPGCVTVDYFAF
jgi:hypothetical protein